MQRVSRSSISVGLSPRARRNPGGDDDGRATQGSISAHAEEPRRLRVPPSVLGVYLRTRGGTIQDLCRSARKCGLSPHTRRNRMGIRAGTASRRSISARAEEPPCGARSQAAMRVYLRTRGGTGSTPDADFMNDGLSPHTRRNPLEDRHGQRRAGSISAHAEEPAKCSLRACPAWVYLRTRGGTEEDHESGPS
ncbi:putative membrane protein [Caballeronia cordobensis]|nr:putative membrane protein [Burkholderia sp. RPE67]